MPDLSHEQTPDPGTDPTTTPMRRRSLVTDILAIQLAITGVIAAIAIGGLVWTSGAVVEDNLSYWAELWAGELNDLGAPFYLSRSGEAVLEIERFVSKYPEIQRVTWYAPDGTVVEFIDKSPTEARPPALEPEMVSELTDTAGSRPEYMLREDLEGHRRFRLYGPIWREAMVDDGLYGFDPDDPDDPATEVELLGFVVVSLDFSAYQGGFQARLVLASLVLISILCASWIGGRALLKRALRPLSELEQPLMEIAEGETQVEFPVTRHSETQAMVTALSDTLAALDKREQHLRRLANHDPVTGLYSRHRLTAELQAASESGGRGWTALCFVDLDQFKYVNDTCGHPAGDQVLKLAAEQLRHAVREEDFVARFGGDEFIVLLRRVSRTEARKIANQILTQMRSFSYVEQGHVFQLQCSVGIASVNFSRFNSHELIAQADMACQTAKSLGRNRVEFYKVSGKQTERMMQDVRWMRVMRDALEGDGFVLHYQPLMHIESGVVSHYEALLRLHSEHGLTGPQIFLPAAVRFGLMADIDRWVVAHAIRALAEASARRTNPRLSINLSSFALEQESFAGDVRRLLKEHGVPGDRIVFEITEQTAVRFAMETDKQIALLRDAGCRIAIDDFGTGYSSFSYLKRLPVDYLKIDGSFVENIVDDPVDQSMVRMVGEVARSAGIKTVAEYVRSETVLRLLARFRIDYAQGFYIGRPGPSFQPVHLLRPVVFDSGADSVRNPPVATVDRV